MFVVYAIAAALAKAIAQFLTKKALVAVSPLYLSCYSANLTVLLLSPYFVFHPVFPDRLDFYFLAALSSFLIAGSIWLINKALAQGSLSTTLPFLSFIPLFTVIMGVLINQETPSALGALGVSIIVVGSFLFDTVSKNDLLSPASLKRKEVQLIALASLCIAAGACLDRQILRYSDFYTCLFFTSCMRAGVLSLAYLIKASNGGRTSFCKKKPLFSLQLISILICIETVFGYLALSGAYAVYGLSIMRLSVLVTTFLGVVLLREKINIWQKFGTAILVTGAVVVGL